jgi:peptide/nickel transport system substrate-binding protein
MSPMYALFGKEYAVHTSQRRGTRWTIIIALLAILTLGAAPTAAIAQQASPTAGGNTLVGAFDVGPGGCPECFNPLQAGAGFTWFEKYFSKLMLYDVNFTKIEGDLAESWEVSPDATQYTIHLRKGVTWHDGQPFTSADVKFTIELAAAPDSASYIGAKFAGVQEIDTPDDNTVVLKLAKGDSTLLDAFTFLVMLPQHALKDISAADLVKSDWWYTNPIGTGPFKWSEYKPGEYVKLVAFDNYWRGRPKIDTLINRYYPEAGSSVIALRSGDIAFTYLSTDEALSLKDDASLKVLSGPSQVVNYLGFNLTDKRFQDARVRQAFMYAIDRGAIVDQLFQGQATIANCAYSLPNYVPGDLNEYKPDPDKAKQLLQDAGWDSSQPVEVVTYYADQLSQDVLVTMQQMLADVGVTITIRTLDVPTFNSVKVDPTKWQVMYAGAANGPEPDVMSTHFESKEANPNVSNFGGIKDPKLDELFAQGRQQTDPEARAQTYQQICKQMNDQAYWAFMWVTTRFGGVSTKVENFIWTPAPGGGRYYDAAEKWSGSS